MKSWTIGRKLMTGFGVMLALTACEELSAQALAMNEIVGKLTSLVGAG